MARGVAEKTRGKAARRMGTREGGFPLPRFYSSRGFAARNSSSMHTSVHYSLFHLVSLSRLDSSCICDAKSALERKQSKKR